MPGLSLGNGGPRSGGRVGRRAARERQVAQLVCARMSSRPACCRVVRIVRGRAFVAAASWRRRGRMVPSLAAETPRRAPLWPVEGCPRRAPKPLPLMNNTVAPSHLLCFLRLQPHSLQHSMIFTVTSRRLPSSFRHQGVGHPRPQDISRESRHTGRQLTSVFQRRPARWEAAREQGQQGREGDAGTEAATRAAGAGAAGTRAAQRLRERERRL